MQVVICQFHLKILACCFICAWCISVSYIQIIKSWNRAMGSMFYDILLNIAESRYIIEAERNQRSVMTYSLQSRTYCEVQATYHIKCGYVYTVISFSFIVRHCSLIDSVTKSNCITIVGSSFSYASYHRNCEVNIATTEFDPHSTGIADQIKHLGYVAAMYIMYA